MMLGWLAESTAVGLKKGVGTTIQADADDAHCNRSQLMLIMPRLRWVELFHLCPVMSNCCHWCRFKGI